MPGRRHLAPSLITRLLARVLTLSGLVFRAPAQLAAHIAHPLQRGVGAAPHASGGFLARLVDLGGRLLQALRRALAGVLTRLACAGVPDGRGVAACGSQRASCRRERVHAALAVHSWDG
jgi:hypothetical protein